METDDRGFDELLATHGVPPWEWAPYARREDETTDALFRLFWPEGFPELVEAATDALLEAAGLPTEEWGRERLWGYKTGRLPSPDLLLVDAEDRVRAVIEVKRDANPQVTSLRQFVHTPRFPDAASHQIPSELGLEDRHEALDFTACTCYCHAGSRNGLVRGGLWQIDVYRHWSGWLPPGVTLDDPESVTWLLLDKYNRSAAELFSDAFSAPLWTTASESKFARRLAAALDLPMTSSARNALINALRRLAA